jgi:hypothetical protein
MQFSVGEDVVIVEVEVLAICHNQLTHRDVEAVVFLVVWRHAGTRGVGSQQRTELWMEGQVEEDSLL